MNRFTYKREQTCNSHDKSELRYDSAGKTSITMNCHHRHHLLTYLDLTENLGFGGGYIGNEDSEISVRQRNIKGLNCPRTQCTSAVVTGGNKGIGLEICRQLASPAHDVLVVLTARDEQKGLQAVNELKTSGLVTNVIFRQLDVTNPASITSFTNFIASQFGKLDILVNSAGINGIVVDEESLSEDKEFKTFMAKQVMLQTYETAKDCIQTNYYGTKHVTKALIPFLGLSACPRIVNISSGLGRLENIKDEMASQMLGDVNRLTEEIVDEVVTGFLQNVKDGSLEEKGWNAPLSAYMVSKAAINAYTRILANKYPSFRINAVNPGFTKTDMTRHKGIYTAEEGAKGAVRLALIPNDGPSGLFFFQMEDISF
ncbi:(+)-neomenthol dehydrogenase-like [Rutidosis leptorrhynchoides]|uniref:(+)-neomenthol dehydrogenase-like n=1 Tax=Rutidosis leptorrhynchoides TaxID=125765 RepID=UPI003A98D939